MNFTPSQEQIAKELCLKIIEKKTYVSSTDRSDMDDSDFNALVGEQIGILYQSILRKVAETTNMD